MSIVDHTLLSLIIGLQNPAMCRILSEGEQSESHVHNTLRVILLPAPSVNLLFLCILLSLFPVLECH